MELTWLRGPQDDLSSTFSRLRSGEPWATGRCSTINWYVVIDLAQDSDGKRRQKWHGGFRTRKEAEADHERVGKTCVTPADAGRTARVIEQIAEGDMVVTRWESQGTHTLTDVGDDLTQGRALSSGSSIRGSPRLLRPCTNLGPVPHTSSPDIEDRSGKV